MYYPVVLAGSMLYKPEHCVFFLYCIPSLHPSLECYINTVNAVINSTITCLFAADTDREISFLF